LGAPTGWPGGELWRGIRKYQKRKGLTVDGILQPVGADGVDEHGVGETVSALRDDLGTAFDGRRVPTPDEVDRHYDGPVRSDGGKANAAPLLEIALRDESGTPPHYPLGTVSDADDPSQPEWRDDTQVAQAVPQQVPAPAMSQPAAPNPQPKPMPLPDFKKSYFGLPANKGAWDQSQSALQRQLPDSPALRGALGRIYAEEGGRIRDPNDTAVGGLTAGTLRDLRQKGLLPGLPKTATPQSLSPDQQITAYRAHLDQTMRHVGGAKALEDLDPDFAHAIADAVFMHGSVGGVRVVQRAIGASGVESGIDVDGGMGAQTFSALKRANDDPALREALQNRIADIRERLQEWEPGELERIGRSRPGAWKR
jgi:peptidoglycan hydrolase-like protein with peptidoglycan-binding domain